MSAIACTINLSGFHSIVNSGREIFSGVLTHLNNTHLFLYKFIFYPEKTLNLRRTELYEIHFEGLLLSRPKKKKRKQKQGDIVRKLAISVSIIFNMNEFFVTYQKKIW